MCNSALHVHAEAKTDPTRTKALRQRFEGEASRRFRNVAGIIREAVVDLDVLGLRGDPRTPTVNRDDVGLPRGAFNFGNTPQKVGAFMRWLDEMQRKQILDVTSGVPVESAARNAWTGIYVRSAYQKGIAHAGQQLRQAGASVDPQWINAAFNRPFHADRLGIIYTRTYKALEGITDAMDTQISRVLTQAIAEGVGPEEMARRLTDRVDKVGRTRARVLARTETINAFSESTLNAYQEANVDDVTVKAEFATAGDSRVCPECARLEGKVYTVAESRGIIPVHPQCFEVGTEINTASGWRQIEDVQIGDEVWSIDPDTLEVALKRVTNTIHGTSRNMIRFGSVAVTPGHTMMVVAGNRLEPIRAEDVSSRAQMLYANGDRRSMSPSYEIRHADVACVEVADYHTLLARNNDGAMWCGNCRCAWLPALDDLRGLDLR